MKQKHIDAYMKTAHAFAECSTARRLNVGAIVVKDNRIISIGYNGMPSGWTNECEYTIQHHELGTCTEVTKPEVLHAEANALMKLTQSTESSLDAEMFVTHVPCIDCAKLIYQAGIKKLTYLNNYEAARGSGLEFLNSSGVEVCHVQKK